MFEDLYPLTLEQRIDARAEEFKAELRHMADQAIDAINVRAGWSTAAINRSRAQRRRFARLRALQEKAA